MVIEIKADGIWFHGSNIVLSELREGSTITQWKELAEAFPISQQYLAMTITATSVTMEKKRDIYILLMNL